jgi:hypothetical protein
MDLDPQYTVFFTLTGVALLLAGLVWRSHRDD